MVLLTDKANNVFEIDGFVIGLQPLKSLWLHRRTIMS